MELEKCAFCGRDINHVKKLIKSPCDCDGDTFICSTCARIAYTVSHSNDEINKKSAGELRRNLEISSDMKLMIKKQIGIEFNMTPSQIHRELDKYVIGQDYAKKVLSVAVYNHYIRTELSTENSNKKELIKRSNVLLLGPSGCGKSLLVKTLSRTLGVPFASADATELTEAGYVGKDVESILQRLLQAADDNNDVARAEHGIVFVDEIDKINRLDTQGGSVRDVSGEGVQAALLKMIEDSDISVPIGSGRKNSAEKTIQMNTRNILFIFGGAFEFLYNNMLSKKSTIGFHAMDYNTHGENIPEISHESLVKYGGLTPEFVGRIPNVCVLSAIDNEQDLIRILTEPEDAITKEYQALFERQGVKLEFQKDALEEIARKAVALGTGARSLRSILEKVMLEIMYRLPDEKDTISKCIITKETIETGEPTIIKKRERRKKAATAASS